MDSNATVSEVTITRFWCTQGFTYNPKLVCDWVLRLGSAEEEVEKKIYRGMYILHSKHKLYVDNDIAGGIFQMLGNQEHASNIVLMAYKEMLEG
jgi:hypothetical protein